MIATVIMKMEEKQARDKIMSTKTDKKGLIIIHTGKGKQIICGFWYDFSLYRS